MSGTQRDAIVGNLKTFQDISLTAVKTGITLTRGGQPWLNPMGDLQTAAEISVAFLKHMSSADVQDPKDIDYVFLNEAEWRIVFTDQISNEPHGRLPVNKLRKLSDNPRKYSIAFDVQDLEALILPDQATKEMTLGDPFIWNWLTTPRAAVPIIATVLQAHEF